MQSGKTEYKSVTVADDATAEEFMDFYLDDSSRHTWVRLKPCHSTPAQALPSTLGFASSFGVCAGGT